MSTEINYKNNPLNGVGLKQLLTETVDHYGFPILFAYLNINCFKTNPSIESSVKFLKKTDWAREKVEAFYLYEFKNLPKASSEQFLLSPRDRIVPDDQTPGTPAETSLPAGGIVITAEQRVLRGRTQQVLLMTATVIHGRVGKTNLGRSIFLCWASRCVQVVVPENTWLETLGSCHRQSVILSYLCIPLGRDNDYR
jgi:uncharacterized protein (DUF2132 family)